MDIIDKFVANFTWYRKLSLALLNEFSDEVLLQQINERSMPLVHQFIDLGEMQIRILEQMTGKKFADIQIPSPEKPNREEIVKYLDVVWNLFLSEIKQLDPKTARLDWFGRMDFNFEEALAFTLAHEAMHHGEILSFVFTKNILMPAALKDTWGFER